MTLSRIAAAEALGTALLLAAVVGSGIMAERLAGGNVALALLANTMATYAILVVLILAFQPISGAQFNPAVTLFLCLRGDLPWRHLPVLTVVQVVGGIIGVWLAHAMFGEPFWQFGLKERSSGGEILSEAVAAFGLILIIGLIGRARPTAIPYAVASYIAAAYWFTASTSFANPAAAIARSFTASFAGIAPGHVPAFVIAEIAGALAGAFALGWFLREADGDQALAGARRSSRSSSG